jgi:predicted esterase
MPYRSLDSSNPFIGKKILVLSGGEDTLVPWSMSHAFVEGLEVGEMGVKKVVIQENTGHECTNEMVEEMAVFIRAEVLARKYKGHSQ